MQTTKTDSMKVNDSGLMNCWTYANVTPAMPPESAPSENAQSFCCGCSRRRTPLRPRSPAWPPTRGRGGSCPAGLMHDDRHDDQAAAPRSTRRHSGRIRTDPNGVSNLMLSCSQMEGQVAASTSPPLGRPVAPFDNPRKSLFRRMRTISPKPERDDGEVVTSQPQYREAECDARRSASERSRDEASPSRSSRPKTGETSCPRMTPAYAPMA